MNSGVIAPARGSAGHRRAPAAVGHRLVARALTSIAALACAAAYTTPRGAAAQALADPARVRSWAEDLDTAVRVFLPKDRSFTPAARQRFRAAVAHLRRSAGGLTDNQIVVGLARAVAASGNAHTRLYILRNRTALRRYPIRVWWFRDGLYVVKARPELRELLGARVVAINGRGVEHVARAVAPLFAGNASWRRYMSTYSLTSPDVLAGLGIAAAEGTASFTFADRRGARFSRTLDPLPLRPSERPTEAWWDLSPLHPGSDGPWVSPLPADRDSLPLYLRHPERWYWSAYLPDERLLYLQLNRAGSMPEGESFADFARRTLEELRSREPERVVVDLRFNTGGDLTVADSFVRELASLPVARRRGGLFIVTGRATFSAGIYPAALLRERTPAIVVGEPVGDALDYWAEGGNVKLPNSGLTLHYADGFHSYSRRERPELRPYYADLSVRDLGPDRPVASTAADWLARRDPALERVLEGRRAGPT